MMTKHNKIVAIGQNPDKRYTFTDEERLPMLTEAAKAHRNVRVDSFQNEYLIDYARLSLPRADLFHSRFSNAL